MSLLEESQLKKGIVVQFTGSLMIGRKAPVYAKIEKFNFCNVCNKNHYHISYIYGKYIKDFFDDKNTYFDAVHFKRANE